MTLPQIRLESACPEFQGRAWECSPPARIGRADALEIVLDHPAISRHHAEIASDEHGWTVRDLGSTNGTFLNGLRVGQAERLLAPRDVLRCGSLSLKVAWLEGVPSWNGIHSRGQAAAGLEWSVPAATDSGSDLMLQTVTAMAQAVELRDQYTGGHTQRVTNYALLLAAELGLAPAQRRFLQIGTPLHDIGKIGLDDAILRKTGALSPEEHRAMRNHTVAGAAILETIPELQPILPIVRSHHERWNGAGYPDGLAGEQIPHLARIVAVADAFDAMVSDRPYRCGLATDDAFAELVAKAGIDFDPTCVNAFLRKRVLLEEMVRQQRTLIGTQRQQVTMFRAMS
jgi:putative nucleotidyltransferase with HDIG domain